MATSSSRHRSRTRVPAPRAAAPVAAPRAHTQDGRAERPAGPSIIEFRGVSKRYSRDIGLDQATFAVDRGEIRDKVPDILRLTGLSTKLHNYPDQLSGGEQQRVSIARAFVNHPPLLLADEPTGNLDPETSIDIMRLLYRINRTGTTVLVATHDAVMVNKMRRRVLELSRGRIVRDEVAGLYARDETTREFAHRLRQPPTRPPGL